MNLKQIIKNELNDKNIVIEKQNEQIKNLNEKIQILNNYITKSKQMADLSKDIKQTLIVPIQNILDISKEHSKKMMEEFSNLDKKISDGIDYVGNELIKYNLDLNETIRKKDQELKDKEDKAILTIKDKNTLFSVLTKADKFIKNTTQQITDSTNTLLK